ncbi:sugar phosphate isomerase/epimerase family protein [Luteococcus sp.]|uniref:sugar phosphate isomerase/epimerase family protein n=1 Tax=Luteococcus sp. TaxID=1969402 RepID=UPI003734E1ED
MVPTGESTQPLRGDGSADAVAPVRRPRSPARVGLSSSCVYPESTAAAFELSAELGWDGVEVMVGIDPLAADIDKVAELQDRHQVAVLSIHAPTLLVTQATWGTDPWEKLERSAEAAQRLGAEVVVVHPPFRWQGRYARTFVDGIRELNSRTGVIVAVENMYPWRTPGTHFQAYVPSWDPTEMGYEHLTLDLSHASTSRKQSLDYVEEWGPRLRHVHITDGKGSPKDEHLFPGEGDQRAFELLDRLAERAFDGHVVLEVNTRKAGSREVRAQWLADCLAKLRHHLGQDQPDEVDADTFGATREGAAR